MEAKPKRSRSRRTTPHVGPVCLACRHETLAVPCILAECSSVFLVCGGCLDELDRYIETDGRCPYCRVQ